MAAGKSVADILAGAKDTLSHANALSDSAHKEADAVAPAPVKHEYSHAPYTLVKKPAPTMKDELDAKAQMVAKAKKALE